MRKAWVAILVLAALPAWAADKKVTVAELTDMVTSLHQQSKTDEQMATTLKQLELTEMLTPQAMNTLTGLSAGQESLAQFYVLQSRSAMLAPPATEIPNDPAPDATAQKALLDKTQTYVANTYSQLPDLSATKTTIRFQDNLQAVTASSGIHGSAKDASTDNGLSDSPTFYHFLGTADRTVESDHGVEKMPTAKDSTPWGANRQIALDEQGPVLANVLNEANGAGKVSFVRWELVNGKKAAVFAFVVDKKKSHYAMNICCYPDTDQAGVANFTSASLAGARGGSGGAKGNFQTNTNWKPWKTGAGYHGELFVNADTGIVVRLINQADLKQSEMVHHEDTRIDFDPQTVGDKTLVIPVREFVNVEDVPGGEDAAAKFSVRHTLFYTEYKNYLAGGAGH